MPADSIFIQFIGYNTEEQVESVQQSTNRLRKLMSSLECESAFWPTWDFSL